MTRNALNRFGMGLLALLVVLWGCSDLAETPMSPDPSTLSEAVVKTKENGTTVVTETDPAVGLVSGTFDSNGGVLRIGNHSLIVPRGAVKQSTIFTMGRHGKELKFSLSATSEKRLKSDDDDDDDDRKDKRALPPFNNVGSMGFRVPVLLQVSYDKATFKDAAALKVYEVKRNVLIEQPTTVDTRARTVTGELKHFSDYAIGFPNFGRMETQ